MISPTVDDWNYISSIPGHLRDCGFHLPAFLCFECPFPGTPYFHRLSSDGVGSFLPNALLRDFTGYTLVVRPKRESVERFVQGYRWLLENVYSEERDSPGSWTTCQAFSRTDGSRPYSEI